MKSEQDKLCKCFLSLGLHPISQHPTGMSCGNAQAHSERTLQCYLARGMDTVHRKTGTNISVNLPESSLSSVKQEKEKIQFDVFYDLHEIM